MKEFVVGAPYTTETTLDDDDEFLIVACDGVSGDCFKTRSRGNTDRSTLPALGCLRGPGRRQLDPQDHQRSTSVAGVA